MTALSRRYFVSNPIGSRFYVFSAIAQQSLNIEIVATHQHEEGAVAASADAQRFGEHSDV
jgi:hypothetical protein